MLQQQSSGFSFGGGLTQQQQPPASTFSFGQPAQQQPAQSFGFGQTNQPQQQQQATSSFGFSQPAQQQQQQPQFNFGQSTQSQPQQPAANSFSFSQPAQQQQQTFGQQAQQPFGQSNQQQGFGQPAQQQTTTGGFGFAQPAQQPAAAAPFSFGQPTQQQQQPAATSFSFGQTTQQQPATSAGSFSFGQPSAQQPAAATQFSFGQPAQQQQAAPATQFSFGSSTAPPATSTSNQFSFGQPTQPAASTGFSFGSSLSQPQQQQPAAATQFSFGTPGQAQPATSSSGGMFSFGNTAGSTTLGGAQTTMPLLSSFQQQQKSQAQPATFGGLGGVPGISNPDATFNSLGAGGARTENRAVKELPLPVELTTLLEEVKTHLKTERIKITEIARVNYKNVEQVAAGLDEAKTLLTNVSNMIQRQAHGCEAFCNQITQDLQNAEMAQLTRETPLALQSEHHLPTHYFYKLIKDFETKMVMYNKEIKKAEAAVEFMGATPGITAQDLCVALKSSKDALVVLAAKIKNLHDRVNSEVETHKNLLRFVHGDTAKDLFPGRTKRGSTQERGRGGGESPSVLFPNRINDPTQLFMTYLSGSKTTTPGGGGGGVLHSTPIFSRSGAMPVKPFEPVSFNTSGFGSASFFQTPASPIFNPHAAASPPPQSGISLKRSKH